MTLKSSIIDRLTIIGEGGPLPLPSWAAFFCTLGSIFATSNSDSRLVAACSVPTRSFAALFSAFGVVVGRNKAEFQARDYEEYFAILANLPLDTGMIYRTPDRVFKAKYRGHTELHGKPYIAIQTSQRKTDMTYVPLGLCMNLEVVTEGSVFLTKHNNGRKLRPMASILDGIYSHQEKLRFINHSELDVAIVGQATRIREEAGGIAIGIFNSADQINNGNFNDVLMIQNWGSAGHAYHSRILHPNRQEIPHECDNSVAVMDGGVAYARAHRKFNSQNTIVILDRTEFTYDETVEEINRRYTSTRISDWKSTNLDFTVPRGIEFMVWEERK